jgi:aspartate kinase
MKVLKFGGTSVADADAIRRVAAIVAAEHERSRGAGPVVVASALGGVTDRLLEVASLARGGNAAGARRVVDELRARHLAVADAIQSDESRATARAEVDADMAHLASVAGALAVTREVSPRSLDAVAAIGEVVSSRLVTALFVDAGIPASAVDPRILIVTDDHFTHAIPQFEATRTHVDVALRPVVTSGRVAVTGGFVAATRTGVVTTLGRGGSDYSAAILGAAIDADEIQIWTDVDGMLTADPRVVAESQLVPFLSFAEAAELAYFGAKVLHPKTIQPAAARNIPVRILNTFRPDAPGTLIADNAAVDAASVTALACKRGITVVTITSTGMLMAHGYMRRLFEVFERFRTPVDVVSTSEVSVSVTIDNTTHLDGIVAALSAFAEVSVVGDLALVAVVGDRYGTDPSAFTRVVRALEGIPLRLVSQADARRNVTLVIDADDLSSAMGRLHAEFFSAVSKAAVEPAVTSAEAGGPRDYLEAGLQPRRDEP